METAEDRTGAAFGDLTTDGPSFTLPNAGDYDFEWGGQAHDNDGGFCVAQFGLFVNAVEIKWASAFGGGTSQWASAYGATRHAGASASHVAKVRYATDGGSHKFSRRVLVIRPFRLS